MKGASNNNARNKKHIMGKNKDLKKPLQVLHINKKENLIENQEIEDKDKNLSEKVETEASNKKMLLNEEKAKPENENAYENHNNFNISNEELEKPIKFLHDTKELPLERTVDEFDFDESEFLEALNSNEPIGATGEITKGKVIALESDGLYVDIGGKAPGFMPKKECGLGVISNFKEKFPIGLEMEVLVIKEQNADGMVTISSRALILRKSWDKVSNSAKNGELIQVLINGFNRGGLTCDVDGLRGFIPRSQLKDGEDHQSQVGKNIKVAFLEVNPELRKLVLSEKKALLVSKFANLKLGQLIEGKVLAIKPYGFFIDLGGASGLLHQSSITKGAIRTLREIFVEGEIIKALITEIDLEKGRIGLNTALLENSAGEIIIDKEKVMNEASDRALKTKALFDKKQNE